MIQVIVKYSAVVGLLCGALTVACVNPAELPPGSTAAGALDAVVASGQASDDSGLGALPRILFLGDSLSRGLGVAPVESVPALIQVRLDAAGYQYRVVNRSNSGDTSASGVRQLDAALEGDVRILVLELGANDMLRGLTTAQLRENLLVIIERSLKDGVAVLLTGMEALPSHGQDYVNRYRDVFSGLAEEYGLVFMPFFLDGVAGDLDLNQADMMHPNAAGARIVAENLWRYLEPMIE
jgi:acyl-CoA thioesterase-1